MPADIATITLNPALDLTIPLPRLEVGAVNRAGTAELRPAGKGVNVSVMLALLGEASLATGLLGEADGPAFEAFLSPRGVTPDFQPVAGRCRINVKVVETENGEVTDINPPGPMVSGGDLDALLARLSPPPSLAVLSGSLPPGLPAEALARVTRHLVASGARVVLDSSGPAFEAALPERPWLVKPNRDELAALLGRPLPDREALLEGALALQARGVSHVVVSAGGEGALFVLPHLRLWVRPPKVKLTTTVGAGDAMVAGLTAGLRRGLDAEALARLATGCAAAAVSRPAGASADPAEIERLARAAQVEVL